MIPDSIRSVFLDPRNVLQTTLMPGGMSGAVVYCCSTDGPSYALKRWPAGTSLDRVSEVHRVIDRCAQSCRLLPKLHRDHRSSKTVSVDFGGNIWELSDWLPGNPLPIDASPEQVAVGGGAIAGVHSALKQQGAWVRKSPGVDQRWSLIQQSAQWLPNALNAELSGRVHPATIDPLRQVTGVLRARWKWNAEQIQTKLAAIRSAPLVTHYILRDVHREHVLFRVPRPSFPTENQGFTTELQYTEGFTPSGMIDFDALRVDSPAFDLARWVSSFTVYDQDPNAAAESVLAGYLARAPLSDANEVAQLRKLVHVFAEASGWLSLLNWVKWLVIETRQFQDFQSVAGRLRRLANVRDVSSL